MNRTISTSIVEECANHVEREKAMRRSESEHDHWATLRLRRLLRWRPGSRSRAQVLTPSPPCRDRHHHARRASYDSAHCSNVVMDGKPATPDTARKLSFWRKLSHRFSPARTRKSRTQSRISTSTRDVSPPVPNNPLTRGEAKLLKASWLAFTSMSRVNIGSRIFRQIFIVSPELQYSFGFNYCPKQPQVKPITSVTVAENTAPPKRRFTGHGDAFVLVLETTVRNLSNDRNFEDVLLPHLHDIGKSHWGYVHTGFEPKYVWSFVQATLNVIETVLTEQWPDFEKQCLSKMLILDGSAPSDDCEMNHIAPSTPKVTFAADITTARSETSSQTSLSTTIPDDDDIDSDDVVPELKRQNVLLLWRKTTAFIMKEITKSYRVSMRNSGAASKSKDEQPLDENI